jgi:transcriptional regulator with XRE-family HTH domain
MILPKELRRLREEKRLSIRELSRKSGVSASYISMLETGYGECVPSERIVHKLGRVLRGDLMFYWMDDKLDQEVKAIVIKVLGGAK